MTGNAFGQGNLLHEGKIAACFFSFPHGQPFVNTIGDSSDNVKPKGESTTVVYAENFASCSKKYGSKNMMVKPDSPSCFRES
ncbi:hypothetical protein [Angelakisella massiliensis]|uniref:hypothetical protein n=1 Tax=Angelakisella massiliensis TaxID=1871018 RepID=UPI0024B1B3E3|nr:hypothetical protein [Angelakisella massiliensis]